jgi:hypothetical protein
MIKQVRFRRQGQRFDSWKAIKEALKVGYDRGYACLLQHDFGKPDSVGVARSAPGKVTLRMGEPDQQLFSKSVEVIHATSMRGRIFLDRLRREC